MNRGLARALAFLTFIVLAAGGLGLFAQTKIGAHGGLSIPNIRGDDTDPFSRGFSSRQGPFFGIFAEIGVSPHFSLVVELNYTSQGGKRNGLQMITLDLPPDLPIPPGTFLYADFNNETVLDYLEIPVMGRVAFGNKTPGAAV